MFYLFRHNAITMTAVHPDDDDFIDWSTVPTIGSVVTDEESDLDYGCPADFTPVESEKDTSETSCVSDVSSSEKLSILVEADQIRSNNKRKYHKNLTGVSRNYHKRRTSHLSLGDNRIYGSYSSRNSSSDSSTDTHLEDGHRDDGHCGKIKDRALKRVANALLANPKKADKSYRSLVQSECNCFPDKDDINFDDVSEKCLSYAQKTEYGRRTWLALIIESQESIGCLSTGLPMSRKLCRSCFCSYHGVPASTFALRKSEVLGGRVDFSRRASKKKHLRPKRLAVMQWLQQYADRAGDYMPDCDEIHLPDYKWYHVWAKMRREMIARGQEFCSYQEFAQSRKTHRKNIKVRKLKRFAKCKVCSDFDEVIEKSTGAAREVAIARKEEHIKWQQREREKYYKHREKAMYVLFLQLLLISKHIK